LFRTYRTNDGGKSWETVNSVRVSDNSWTTRGLDVTTNYGVHFDPFDPQHLIISYTDIGAFHSYDGGSSWTSATNGVPTNWRNTTYWVVFDPEVRGRLWGAFSGIHDLPRPKMWRHRDPKTFVGGVGISNDGGKTWRPSHAGMPPTSVTHILLDPASPIGARTLYACGFGRGVYKSTDDGKTWTLKNQGLEDAAPFAWRLTRADDGTLYLVVARRSEGNDGDGGDGAIYRSRDGADHWEKIRLPENVNGPVGLTLDPRDNRRMYLSAWGQGRADVDVGGGVFLTTDAGTTWKPVFQQSQHVYDVTVDPENSRVIYAAGFDAGAWRSDDGGTTWNRLRGYTFKWGHRVVPDPVNPAMIYINTYGGSVWHGPARPAPDVPEDIQNPVPVASASPAQSAPGPRIVRPKEIDSVLVNPGIGFTTLNRFNGDPLNPGTKWTEGHPIEDYPFQGKLDVAGQPLTSIAYFRVYWKYVEPEMGQYNWKMLDAALRTAHERGQSLMLRVAPYGPEPKTEDVPGWYRKLVGDEMGKAFPDKWRTDPEDPRYVKHWTNLVRALGARYDGHPDLDSVDVSIVGFWGEGEHTDQLSEPTMHVLVDSYLEAFTKTPLMMQPTDRRTNTYALSKSNAGWRADCLGDMRCVDGHWCHMFDAYPEAVASFGIQEAWRKGPVSLEACWVMQGWKIRGWDIDYIVEQSLKWHISSFNNKSSAVPEEWWPQVRYWLNKMGYRFVLRRFTYPEVVAPHGKLEFTSWWENKGVAPCYRQFPLALRLRGEKRTEVLLTDADIRNWLPGDAVYDDAVFIPADLPAGRYDLQIGVLDPQTRRPKVKLAIEGIDGEGWYTLGGITVSSPASPSSAVSPR
jgi:photosystem II stability/assembly factor-like uncharacterized protein